MTAPATDALRPEEAPAFWSIRDIQFHCRIARATAWRLVRSDGFPAPIVIGSKTVRWQRDEVLAFVDAKRDEDHYSVPVKPVPAGTTPRVAPFVARRVRGR